MSSQKSAIIIGAGIGGIATSAFLAQNGYRVDVFEKNSKPGGRCGQLTADGYRFDLGATMLVMPGIYRQVFGSLGIPLFESEDITSLKDIYHIYFDDDTVLDFTTDEDRMKQQLEALEPGSFRKAQRYVKEGYETYELGIRHIIDRQYRSVFDLMNLKNLAVLPKLNIHRSHYSFAKRFFRNEYLRMAFTFQNIYVGQSPFDSPALFSLVPAAELFEGSFFPKGGMYAIVQKLIDCAIESGVRFHYHHPVEKILTNEKTINGRAENRKTVTGVVLKNGMEVRGDVVVANADLPYVYRLLLPESHEAKRIDRMRYTCSAISFHWGLDKVYPQLGHHNVFLSDAYRDGLRSIFVDKSVNDRPGFYVHAPVRTDPSAAPPGHDALSVIVGAGHVDPGKDQDWGSLKKKSREAVLRRLHQLGMSDVEDHIRYEACYLPSTWAATCHITRGAVFGSLAHNLRQMACFRPGNKHNDYDNLYFTGGSTHPGSGIPNVLLSARLTSERILNKKL